MTSTHARHVGSALLLGLVATLASTWIDRSARVRYADIDGCTPDCSVAAAGFPFAFIVDYPGISPVGSVSLFGVLLDIDRVRVPELIGTFACWSLLAALCLSIVRARSRASHATR